MIREIMIDGRPVKFKASAGVPRMYRIRFGRDIIVDLNRLMRRMQQMQSKDDEDNEDNFDALDLTIFENVAYIMARHADPSIPDTPEEWLDQFETFSIYMVLPEILGLWEENLVTIVETKKKYDQ